MKPGADAAPDVPAPDAATAELHRRGIRSFVLRQGRTSPAQTRAVETLLPRFGVSYRPDPVELAALFGRQRQLHVEFMPAGAGDDRQPAAFEFGQQALRGYHAGYGDRQQQ